MPEVDPHQSRYRPAVPELSSRCERDHYKRTKIYPIMHLVAIKKTIYEKLSVRRDAACTTPSSESKKIALERMFN